MTKPKPVPSWWENKTPNPYAPPVPAITGKRQKPPLHQPKEKPPTEDFRPPLPRTES